MTLTDVYENSKYVEFAGNHHTYWKPQISSSDEVINCEILGDKCKSLEEFNKAIRPYLND